ncbi:MAG: VOC family protein [Solirubrobacterales bacterium]|nr:VOC family protein [Solirubrobacterales bacterium]
MALSKIEHVLVLTEDIEGTRDFYREALGLEVGERPPLEFPGYWLYAEGVPCIHVADREAYTAHSATLGTPASRPAESTGALDHLAFSGDDDEEALARLERYGIEAKRNTVPGIGMRQLFFKDPNGIKIEINVMPPEGGKED